MKIEILKQKETPLLKRKRVNCMVDFVGATPGRTALREALGKQLKVDKKLVAIRHVYQRYGLPRAKVIVHIYKDFETLKKREMLSEKKLKAYEEPKEEKKAEEKPVEAPKVEEKPVEEKKEEAPKVEEKDDSKADTPKKEEKPVEAKEDGKKESKEQKSK
tara:strand:- start:1276 stop:1755 length:480 start_codon:yes stop_codon:yes gene_type:complete